MANPDPKKLAYFDNANHVPAPYGVNVPFNQEQKDIWLGYDEMTGQLCITNFNRTVIIVCIGGAGAANLYKATTEDDTPTVLLNSAGGKFAVGGSGISAVVSFKIQLTGALGNGDSGFTAHIEGGVKNVEGAISLVGVPTINVYADAFPTIEGWSVNVVPNSTDGTLDIVVIGGNYQVKWCAEMSPVEITIAD
jgi:hypothetical protein